MKSIHLLVAALIAASAICILSATSQAVSRARPQLAPRLRTPNQTTEKPKTSESVNQTTKPPKQERSVNTNRTSSQVKRVEIVEDELPADFYEMPPEQLDLGMNATGRAPVPMLNVAVLQDGRVIDSEINVHPGTPLEMMIWLDDKSAKVYGLLASFLKVQDDTLRQREEVIISNGCSIDTYIFGNFEHNPEDQSLRAKFRAFKFPDSNFVRFVGTVNVCIKQCAKVNCSGKGRKKRASIKDDSSSNLKLTVSTVLRISNNNF